MKSCRNAENYPQLNVMYKQDLRYVLQYICKYPASYCWNAGCSCLDRCQISVTLFML